MRVNHDTGQDLEKSDCVFNRISFGYFQTSDGEFNWLESKGRPRQVFRAIILQADRIIAQQSAVYNEMRSANGFPDFNRFENDKKFLFQIG